jgi:hypothetical protein
LFTGQLDLLDAAEIALYIYFGGRVNAWFPGPPPAKTGGGGRRPLQGLVDFADRYKADLVAMMEAIFTRIGIPREMWGWDFWMFNRAFSDYTYQGGGNRGTNTGNPGIYVDHAVFDGGFVRPEASPTWGRAKPSERAEAVAAHEYTEATAPASITDPVARHNFAIDNAPETTLRIGDIARQLLREQREARDNGIQWHND